MKKFIMSISSIVLLVNLFVSVCILVLLYKAADYGIREHLEYQETQKFEKTVKPKEYKKVLVRNGNDFYEVVATEKRLSVVDRFDEFYMGKSDIDDKSIEFFDSSTEDFYAVVKKRNGDVKTYKIDSKEFKNISKDLFDERKIEEVKNADYPMF